jgi:hypothetical protein
MSENWRQAYMKVTDFITNHSEIKIEPSIVRIHETVRPEFYQLFKVAREAFIKERNKALLDEAEVISKKYLQVEEEVIKLLGLERISLFPRVDGFLNNPIDELIKELNNPFFNLLKGRIDITKYEEEASNILVSYFDLMYQQGYEVWITLSLIKLLEADKSFRVDADEFDDDEYFKHGGGIEVPVPKPEELREISFKHNPIIGVLVADQIVHSAKNGQYFSFRPHIVEPEGEATNKSTQREWMPLPVRTIMDMGSNVILVYMDKRLEELSLIADSKIICRPDLIIECVGLKKLFNEKSLAKMKKYNEDFKPRLGTYIISNEPVIEKMSEGQVADIISNEPVAEKIPEDKEKDIHFLSIGFDQSKLEQVINLFTNKENNDS